MFNVKKPHIVSWLNIQINWWNAYFAQIMQLLLCVHCPTQQTHNICITFLQRRPNVFDVGPTLYKCYTNVLCLLGRDSPCYILSGAQSF